MKRPEGFDPAPQQPEPRRGQRVQAPGKPQRPAKPVAKPGSTVTPGSTVKPERTAKPERAAEPERPARPQRPAGPERAARPPRGERNPARRELRAAAKERRRYERSEAKRFTRSRRRRRNTWLVLIGVVVVFALLIVGAVFSPLLALRTISVTGASRVDAKAVSAALDDQLGTPLALVDFGEIRRELAKFPLIRSYVTESVPPHTLVIKIQERTPIGSVATADGFTVVDAAGIEIESGQERVAGLPLIQAGDGGVDSPAFASAAEVLLALPADLLAKVDSISAQSKDDVTLTLTGAGQLVDWGSPEKSALKARVLAALIAAQGPDAAVRYDVSAPNTPVVGAP